MTNFYFTDRKYNLIDIVADEGTRIQVTDVTDVESIGDTVRKFEAVLTYDENDFALAEKLTAVGNFILYKNIQGASVWITIEEQSEYDPVDGTVRVIGRDASIDLINEVLPPFAPDKQYSIKEYIDKFVYDSGFVVGLNEIPDNKRKLPAWENENTSLERIISVANQFDVELDFSFDIDGLDVIKKHVNIYKKRGTDVNPVTLYVGKEIDKIVTSRDLYEFANSIQAIGGIPEGKDRPINLKGYAYTDPNGKYILDSGGLLKDSESVKEWSRLLSNENPNPQSSYIVRSKSYDTVDQKKLFEMAMSDLKKSVKLTENYEVTILDFPSQIGTGDTINLVDERHSIYLSARVLVLEYDHIHGTVLATLGDYLVQQVSDNSMLRALANELQSKMEKIQIDGRGKAIVVTSETPPEGTNNIIWIDISSPYTPIKTWHEETQTWIESGNTSKIVEDAKEYTDGKAAEVDNNATERLHIAQEEFRKKQQEITRLQKEAEERFRQAVEEANAKMEEIDKSVNEKQKQLKEDYEDQSSRLTNKLESVKMMQRYGTEIFRKKEEDTITFYAFVFRDNKNITDKLSSNCFTWRKINKVTGDYDTVWNNAHKYDGQSVTYIALDNDLEWMYQVTINQDRCEELLSEIL
ncbi:hypothetical protein DOK78_002360 [Enterococcus sp. DIV2402]|uniref:Prophage tail endopeptidase domain-containing protein n=1 Tax=Candidatus Enterococcus lowellii TaxID=2230877 RepID=A0ABZ2SQ99_9ENTE|nr:phage tail protein [Enterococcus sp. DIV2402]MBO0463521.1 phage tail protein [Enterococcus sp. DIV2402]